MTVPSATNRVDYVGNGATSVFPYTFRVFVNTDLKVTEQVIATGVETLLVLTTDYTVSGVGDGSGGNVTRVAGALPSTKKITIRRVRPLTQGTDIRNQGDFFPETHEDEFDRGVMVAQQQQNDIDRSLKLPETETPSAALSTIPVAALRALKVLGFDSLGQPTAVANVPTSGVAASAFMETVLDDLTAAAARTTLGFAGAGGTVQAANIEDAAVTGPKLASSAIAQIFQARLTLATATPITTADQLAKGTIFLTPFRGDKIALYDGTNWKLYTLAEISIAVPAATSQMHDIFVFDSGGTPTLELLAWTNDTTRATAIVLQNGVYVKSGATTRRYAGSFRTTTVANQTEDSLVKRYLWNYYNRVARPMRVIEATDSWTSAVTAFRQANGSVANQLDFVIGVAEDPVSATVAAHVSHSSGTGEAASGVGLDSTTVSSSIGGFIDIVSASGEIHGTSAFYKALTPVGRHFLAWLEYTSVATATFYGDNVNDGTLQSGIVGEVLG